MRSGILVALATVAACADGPGPTALFTVPRGGGLAPDADLFALPFPHDFWRRADGLDLSLYPRPLELVGDYVDAIATRLDGFGRNAAVFARFDGPIDVGRLPATPQAAQAEDASVYLVDVDPASPERGARWPLRFRFEPFAGETIGEHWLSALPYPGFPLAEGRTYALVVTTRLDVRASDDWRAVAGGAALADPDLARARTASAPLLDWLDLPGGDERDDVASAAVFTTQRSTAIVPGLRARVWQGAAPTLGEAVRRPDGPGYRVYDGVFAAPNFQRGEPPYAAGEGEIVLDPGDGLPVVQRTEALRVSFTVPADRAMPASGWPVALYAHGTGGDFRSFQDDGTARRLAAEGIAAISIDQVLHGPRNPGGNPELDFFDFQNPLAARDNPIQGAADDFSLVRLVLGIDHDGVRFDPARIYFFGHSQGGLTGPPFLAFESLVDGAVLSGAGGLIYLSLLHKTEPIDITAIVGALLRDDPLDEFNPILALLQTWIERADPVNYGPLLARAPVEGIPAKHVFQSEGLVDHYTPVPSIEALATAIGGDQVAPALQEVPGLALRGRGVVAAPVAGNLDATTVVLVQYRAAEASDGHFVVFDVPAAEAQSARFLGSLAETGTGTVIAP